MKELMDKLGETAPKIIAEASKNPLGVVSLGIMALSVLGYFFFANASETVRVGMFVLMFVGFGLLSVSLLKRTSSSHTTAVDNASLTRGEIENKEVVFQDEPQAESTMTTKLERHGVKSTHAIKRLTLLWFIASILLFGVLLLQTIFGKYGERSEAAWAWFLPTLLPTLSVLVASQVATALKATEFSASNFAYRLSMSLSTIYLVLVFAVIFLQPFVALPALTLQMMSNLWLAPLQGLVLASMIFMFASRK